VRSLPRQPLQPPTLLLLLPPLQQQVARPRSQQPTTPQRPLPPVLLLEGSTHHPVVLRLPPPPLLPAVRNGLTGMGPATAALLPHTAMLQLPLQLLVAATPWVPSLRVSDSFRCIFKAGASCDCIRCEHTGWQHEHPSYDFPWSPAPGFDCPSHYITQVHCGDIIV